MSDIENEIEEIARAAAGATSKTPEPVSPADDSPEEAAILSAVNPGYKRERERAQAERRQQEREDAPLSSAQVDEARLLRDLQIPITKKERAAIDAEHAQLEASKRARSATLDEPTIDRRAGADAVVRQRAIEHDEANYWRIAAGIVAPHIVDNGGRS